MQAECNSREIHAINNWRIKALEVSVRGIPDMSGGVEPPLYRPSLLRETVESLQSKVCHLIQDLYCFACSLMYI